MDLPPFDSLCMAAKSSCGAASWLTPKNLKRELARMGDPKVMIHASNMDLYLFFFK
jgi:hypothetical protein